MRDNIIVYDKDGEFIQLLKKYCGKKIDVIFCSTRDDLAKLNLSEFSIAFIITNDIRDLVDIVRIYNHIDQIHIETNSLEIKKIIYKLHNINFFCRNRDRFEIMNLVFNKIIGFEDKIVN